MKILLLITDLEIGGTPTVVRELAIRLSGRHQMVIACLSKWGPVADQLKEAGIEVIAFGATGSMSLPRVVRDLVRLIRREKIDTVFSFLIHANAVAAIASPFCGGVRFLQSIQTTQPAPKWHWWLQSIVQYAAEKIVVPSPSAAVSAMDWAGVPAEKLVVISNASASPTGILPVVSSDKKDHGQDAHGTRTIGFIGRLDPIKRVSDLVAAISLLDAKYRLEIFGDGPDRPIIESEIARSKLQERVTLRGTIPHPQSALESIDVLVLPSAAEGFGLVLIEAMAAGVPVVATNVPGIRDVVQDGVTGLLVPVASPQQLASAIRLICESDALRNQLTANAAKRVREKYSWDVVLPQYESLLS